MHFGVHSVEGVVFVHLREPSLLVNLLYLSSTSCIQALGIDQSVLCLLQMSSPDLSPVLLLQLQIHPPS